MMSNKPPAFLLKVAESLVGEVAQETSSLLDSIHRLGKDVDYTKVVYIAMDLRSDLSCAIGLADKAAKQDPNIMLPDEATVSSVKAKAYFQMGLIAMAQKKFKDAINYFEESLKYDPDQATYYNIGLCYLRMKGLFTDKTQEAIAALQKCIDMNPETDTAIDAGKILARRGLL
jgi:tetratricopeptide (TPR) repeat protein